MNVQGRKAIARRHFLRASAGGALLLTVPACSSIPGFSMTDAIRRLLLLSSERAFLRLTEPGGYWDGQVARLGLNNLLGTSGNVLTQFLTSAVFKDRLETAFAGIAVEGAERAAPIVADTVRIIGIPAAVELVRGGPQAATSFLRGEMGGRLIDEMVPELGDAIRIASDPLVGQLVQQLTGTDVGGIAQRLANSVDDSIWQEIGLEEAAIRADPGATGDPLLMGALGTGGLF